MAWGYLWAFDSAINCRVFADGVRGISCSCSDKMRWLIYPLQCITVIVAALEGNHAQEYTGKSSQGLCRSSLLKWNRILTLT